MDPLMNLWDGLYRRLHPRTFLRIDTKDLNVRPAHIAAMQADVGRLISAGVLRSPSTAQWQMILSPATACRVLAGAGSGKSSALLLRLIFLLRHLQIDDQHVSLFSFTRASCQDLRTRLLHMARVLAWPYSEPQARHLITTFHARLLSAHPPCHIFMANNEDTSSPLLLRRLYSELWQNDRRFRRTITALLDILRPATITASDPERRRHDAAEVQTHAARLGPPQRLPGLDLHAHVFVQGHYLFLDEALCPDGPHIERRRQHFVQQAPGHAHWLSAEEGQAWLCGQGQIPRACPPMPRVFCPGDAQPRPLHEHLWLYAQYLHALGEWIPPRRARSGAQAEEKLLLTALHLFMRHLQRRLQQLHRPSYDMLFLQAPASTQTALCHLLIDEAQDINRPTLLWLLRQQQDLQQHGHAISLMAIGDDWQSIYGWRGACSDLLLDLHQHVRRAGQDLQDIVLPDNFRSTTTIVSASQCALEDVSRRSQRHTQAHRCAANGPDVLYYSHPHILGVHVADPAWRSILQLLERLLQPSPKPPDLLLMSARQSLLAEATRRIPLSWRQYIRLCSLHAAKGLEADTAVILGDIPRAQGHDWRDRLLRAHLGLSDTRRPYAEQQEDEARRLAYVGLSRARTTCLWIGPPPPQASLLLQRWLQAARPKQHSLAEAKMIS